MELIKRKILLATTTGTTSGCTGTCRVIIPDLSVTYIIKYSLSQEINDLGFFDSYGVDGEFDYIVANDNFFEYLNGNLLENSLTYEHSNGIIYGDNLYENTYTITGECKTRLIELRKYTVSNVFTDQYPINGGINSDGVDVINTTVGSKITYYIKGIMYVDIIENGVIVKTTFKLAPNSINEYNFINKPIYKNEYKSNIIDNPKINDNLFIDRREISVFENNYKLEFLNKLVDVLTYVGGKYFHVKESN